MICSAGRAEPRSTFIPILLAARNAHRGRDIGLARPEWPSMTSNSAMRSATNDYFGLLDLSIAIAVSMIPTMASAASFVHQLLEGRQQQAQCYVLSHK